MSLTAINKTRRFGEGTSGSNSAFWSDLGSGQPPQLLGRDLHEYSAISSSFTTGQVVAVYGALDKFRVVDHVGSTRLEYIPNMVDVAGGTGRPTGQRGFMLWWRTASDMLDADAARVLVL